MLLCEHMTSRAISGPWLLGWDFGWREGKLVVKKEEEGRRRSRRGGEDTAECLLSAAAGVQSQPDF